MKKDTTPILASDYLEDKRAIAQAFQLLKMRVETLEKFKTSIYSAVGNFAEHIDTQAPALMRVSRRQAFSKLLTLE